MKRRLLRIVANPAVADAIESERIRDFQREFDAKHSALDLEAYQAALASLTHKQLVWLTCPPDGLEFDLDRASDQLLEAFISGETDGLEDELCEELERIRLPAGWRLDNPAQWVRAKLRRV